MVYKHNKTGELVEVLYSDNTIVVFVSKFKESGSIFKGNKREFKKIFSKTKELDFVEPVLKEHIIETVKSDYVGITEYPQDYSQWSAAMWQSEEEFKNLLEELKDK